MTEDATDPGAGVQGAAGQEAAAPGEKAGGPTVNQEAEVDHTTGNEMIVMELRADQEPAALMTEKTTMTEKITKKTPLSEISTPALIHIQSISPIIFLICKFFISFTYYDFQNEFVFNNEHFYTSF